jgi:hypothetical protein
MTNGPSGADPDLSVTLEYLCRIEAQLGAISVIGPTPSGSPDHRRGDRRRDRGRTPPGEPPRAAAGDWLTLGPDGTTTLDVRMTLATDDGALVHLRYGGRSERTPENPYNYVAAVFEAYALR